MPPLRIHAVLWDEANVGHATRRATATEIEQVLFAVRTIYPA